MRILITGAKGFIAQFLIQALRGGGLEVWTTDRAQESGENYRACDLGDFLQVRKILAEIGPDVIVHLAAKVKLRPEEAEDEEKSYSLNPEITKHLYDALHKEKVMSRVILISTSEVYGNPERLPLTEASTPKPLTHYATSKYAQEKVAMLYLDIPTTILRFFHILGPGQTDQYAVSSFVKQAVEISLNMRKPRMTTGNLDVARDFTDVRDVAQAVLAVIRLNDAKRIYNVCSGNSHKLKEIIEILLQMHNLVGKVEIAGDPSLVRANDVSVICGSAEELISATNWKQSISLQQTLADMSEFWRNKLVSGARL